MIGTVRNPQLRPSMGEVAGSCGSQGGDVSRTGSTRLLGRVLVALALALLAAAGGLLWWHRGAAVFGELMLAGLAWCL
jgi:hypothetical protein